MPIWLSGLISLAANNCLDILCANKSRFMKSECLDKHVFVLFLAQNAGWDVQLCWTAPQKSIPMINKKNPMATLWGGATNLVSVEPPA